VFFFFTTIAYSLLALYHVNTETVIYHRHNSKGHTVIRGHALVTENKVKVIEDATMPVLFLDRQTLQAPFDIIFVGHFADLEKQVVREQHAVNYDALPAQANFYLEHNVLYKDLPPEARLPVPPQCPLQEVHITRTDLESYLGKAGANVMENAYSSNHIPTTSTPHCEDGGSSMGGLVGPQQTADTISCSRHYSVFPEMEANTSNFRPPPSAATVATYRASSYYVNNNSGSIYAYLYPQHYPFGIGHPGQKRRVPISEEDYFRSWALSLGSNDFAGDASILLYAFDRLSKKKAFGNFIEQRFFIYISHLVLYNHV
jgi:hypothetical protein